MKRKYAFVINYGPELRSFVVSGISKELGATNDVIFLIKESVNSNEIDFIENDQIIKYDVNQLKKRVSIGYRTFIKFDTLFKKIRQMRSRNIGLGNYHFTKGTSNNVFWYDKIMGSHFFYNLFRIIYKIWAPKAFHSKYFESIITSNKVTDIIYYGSNMYEMKILLHTADNQRLKLWYYIGNWKDIYIDDFIPVIPTKVFVWSEQLKTDFLTFNKFISPDNVNVSGNWFFYRFKDYKPVFSKEFYANKYEFKSDRKVILWPLSMSVIFPNEHILLKKIDSFIENLEISNRPVILLRDNPFGKSESLRSIYSKMSNVKLANNYWKVNSKEDFTFQSDLGETEWMDLLYHCSVIVSTPSTVTLEGMLMEKRVLNVLFDETGKYNLKLSEFSNAPFYATLKSRSDLTLMESLNQLLSLINSNDFDLIEPTEIPSIINGNFYNNLNSLKDTLLT